MLVLHVMVQCNWAQHSAIVHHSVGSTSRASSWRQAASLLTETPCAGLEAAESEYLEDVADLVGDHSGPAPGSLPQDFLQHPGRRAGQWPSCGPVRRLHSHEVMASECELCGVDEAGLSMCPFLNASACATTVEATCEGQGFKVVLYNPLAWPRKELVRVPISTAHAYWTVSGVPRCMPVLALL